MKASQIVGVVGFLAILGVGAWYLYLQSAPLPAAEGDSKMTDQRGLKNQPASTKKAVSLKWACCTKHRRAHSSRRS